MKIIKFLDDYLELYISIFLISLMTVVLAIQVFMRYVMQNSLSWSEELSRYIFVWLVYISISYGAKIMRHIRIEAALSLYPRKLRPYILIVGDILFMGFGVFICYTSWFIIKKQLMIGQTSPALGMPMWILYSAPFVGFGLTCFRQIQTIIYRLKNIDTIDGGA